MDTRNERRRNGFTKERSRGWLGEQTETMAKTHNVYTLTRHNQQTCTERQRRKKKKTSCPSMLLHTAALRQRGGAPAGTTHPSTARWVPQRGFPAGVSPRKGRASRASPIDGGGGHPARGSRGRAPSECWHAPRPPRRRSPPSMYDARRRPAAATTGGRCSRPRCRTYASNGRSGRRVNRTTTRDRARRYKMRPENTRPVNQGRQMGTGNQAG